MEENTDVGKEFEEVPQEQPEVPEIPEENKNFEKKSQKNMLVLLSILVIVMLAFVGMRYFSQDEVQTLDDLLKAALNGELDESQGYAYNGFAFVSIDGLWYTKIMKKDEAVIKSALHFGPKELEDVPIEGSLDDTFLINPMYITIDANSTQQPYLGVAGVELGGNMYKAMDAVIYTACTTNDTACEGRPVVTCDNSSPVIYLKTDNETKIILDGNCVTLQGNEWGVVKAADKFLLMLYGIIED